MKRSIFRLGSTTLLLLSSLLTIACSSTPRPSALPGAYRFEDGRLIAISYSAEESFRYRDLQSGASGHLYPAERRPYPSTGDLHYLAGPGWATEVPVILDVHFRQGDRQINGLVWKEQGETAKRARRVPLGEEEIRFRSGDAELYGKLVLPAEGEGPFPLVILVHGSEKNAATLTYHRQYQFPAHGVATFVYDKRGTGRSQGQFTMQFDVLAGDVLAAVERLRSHPRIAAERIGLAGYSQGGWIAPLAASKSPHVKFILVGYGMLESPAQEDRLETHNTLRAKGFGDAEIRKADEILDAAYRILKSDLKEGWDEMSALVKKSQKEPWLPLLQDSAAGAFLRHPQRVLKTYGRSRLLLLSWSYEPLPVVERLNIPMLWVLGGNDLEAPNQVTIAELQRLKAAGKPIDLEIFPNADHGILEFEEKDGRRVFTRYAPGYFELESEWVRKQAGAGS